MVLHFSALNNIMQYVKHIHTIGVVTKSKGLSMAAQCTDSDILVIPHSSQQSPIAIEQR